MEQRVPGHAADLGRAVRRRCGCPKLFNLRTDPFERADITSNTYYDWFLDNDYIVLAATAIVDAVPGRRSRSSRRARRRRASPSTRWWRSSRACSPPGSDAATARDGVDPGARRSRWAPTTTTPRRRPAHPVAVDGFWIDRHAVTNARVRRVRRRDRLRHRRRAPARPGRLPRRAGGEPRAGLARLHRHARARSTCATCSQWWTWTPGACWRHPEGPASTLDGREDHPVVHVAYEDAERLRRRGPARRCRPRPSGSCAARGGLDGAAYTWGDEPEPPGAAAGQLLARRLPLAARARATARPRRSARSRPTATACSTWPATSGSGRRDWYARATPSVGQAVLRAAQPARRGEREASTPPAAVPDPAQGDQGRLVPVRRQLLPALPAGRPPAADDRHRHEPHRLPLRGQGVADLAAAFICSPAR